MSLTENTVSTWLHHFLHAAKRGKVFALGDGARGDMTRDVCREAKGMGRTILSWPHYVLQADGDQLSTPAVHDYGMETWAGLPHPNMILEFQAAADSNHSNRTVRVIIFAQED